VKQTAQRIFHDTLAAIDIRATLAKKLSRSGSQIRAGKTIVDLCDFQEIIVIAFGKASFPMADGLCAILSPDYAMDGILVAPVAPPRTLPGWKIFVGGHPVPNAESFAAGRAILDRLGRCDEKSLIFFLISGGGSSLVEQPLDASVILEDFQKLNLALVTCGAPIEEINAVRKHVSGVKGGRLAAAAPLSMKLTFAISDVPQGQETALASGPTLPDPTTVFDAERIVSEYDLLDRFPASIQRAFEEHNLDETPKEGDPAFDRAHFVLLLGAHELLHAAHRACEGLGYVCLCDDSTDNWPLEKAADHLLRQLEAQQKVHLNKPVAVLADGEVSSPLMGDGIGGRNSAFVLACVPKIAGKKVTVLSVGTDGIDGNSPAAGAVADGETLERARAAGLELRDFSRRSDAYSFFAHLGDAIITGPTGNNLRDLRIFLAE
jgi:hydroxypyruvate reductase